MTTLPALLRDHVGDLEQYDPDQSMEGRLRFSLILVGALVFGLGSAAALVPIGGAVVGSGQVGSESAVKRISHPTGGTVAEILVENGQHVRKGQLLIRLDNKVSGTDAELTALSVDQMLAQKARLEAERLGSPDIVFPTALTSRTDAAAQKAMADERKMFAIHRSEAEGLSAQLRARIGQFEQQITGYEAQIQSLRQQSALIKPERDGVRQLYEKKLVTLNRLNQLERTAVDLDGSIGALNAQIAQARAHISETREQIIQLGETRRADAGTQLANINSQLNQQQVRSVSAADQNDRSAIRAPYDGVVEKLTVTTIGGVIRPADVVMEIVPDKESLTVEGAISPSDIDQVHVNQTARVRFSSLSVTVTPELHGRLVYVAADKVTDPESRRSYFPVRIALDPVERSRDRSLPLKNGTPAEIFIETGERSMLSYVTKPLRDQVARAFKDN